MKAQTTRRKRCLYYLFLCMVSAFFVLPILLVLMNSLKGKLYISATPFAFPNKETFVGLQNYAVGLAKVHFYADVTDDVPEGTVIAEGVYTSAQSVNGLTVNALLSQTLTDAGAAATLCDNVVQVRRAESGSGHQYFFVGCGNG